MAAVGRKSVVIIGTGLIAISFAAIFIRWCSAPSLAVCFYRLALAGLLYLALACIKDRHVLRRIPGRQFAWMIVSGIFLSLHFITWVSSLRLTSVASSVVLVQTAPIFVALGSAALLHEKMSWQSLLGIFLAICGGLAISGTDSAFATKAAAGNLLAVAGAVCAAGYFLSGRKARQVVATAPYAGVVYCVAAIIAFIVSIVRNTQLVGFSSRDYLLLLAIALAPQAIGHTSLNWALKHFSATTVSVLMLAEPIGATILAFFLLQEMVSLLKILGGCIILLGVVITLLAERKSA